MKSNFFLIFSSIIFLTNCIDKFENNQTTNDKIETIPVSTDTNIFFTKQNFPEKHWKLISNIRFQVTPKIKSLVNQTNDTISWINIDNPNIFDLIDANEIIVPYKSVKLVIDYPMQITVVYDIKTKKRGFTREDLISIISHKYHLIYQEEDSNRRVSKKYGICCHDISDLDLGSIQVYENFGVIYLVLSVGS